MEMVSNSYMREKDPTKRAIVLERLYQKYVGHDNNRDFYMSNQVESTNMNRVLYREWYPQIMYNHHQTGPAGTVLFAPPFRDPFNYFFDPLIPIGLNLVGAAMHDAFAAEGKPGATMLEGSSYSTWFNGGLRTTTYFHNMIGLLTETIGHPTPMEVAFVPRRLLPNKDTPYPVEPGQKWHFRQSIEYSVTANRAVLDLASRLPRYVPVQHVPHGQELDRPRQFGSLDHDAEAPGSARGGDRQGQSERAWNRSGLGGDAPGGGGVADRASTSSISRRRRIPSCAIRAVHYSFDASGFRDGDQVREHALEERYRHSSRVVGFRSAGQEISGGIVRDQVRAGVPAAYSRHVRAAGSSQRFQVRGRAADAALRRRRDGRWRTRWAWNSIACWKRSTDLYESDRGTAGAAEGKDYGAGDAGGLSLEPSRERLFYRGKSFTQGGRRSVLA
jgi:hypothetical protein